MKKNFWVIMIALMMIMTGCGKEAAESEKAEETNSEIVETVDEISEDTEEIEENIETEVQENKESSTEDKEKIDLNLKEYKNSFEDRSVDTSGPYIIPFEEFKPCGDTFYLTDSVDLYIDNGTCVGYTKPDIEIIAISEYEDWYYIAYGSESKFAKKKDVEASVGAADTQEDIVEEETPNTKEGQDNVIPVNPEASDPTEETPVGTTTTSSEKYTPEEAVEVYRSLMEAGGIVWDPSLKNGGSWGTGFLYLDKGYPEWCASTDLESYKMGDGAGNPWTKYYLEITGSDELTVYITGWHN